MLQGRPPRRLHREAPGADPHPHTAEVAEPKTVSGSAPSAPSKYEHLYRLEIDDGSQLGLEGETYRQLFNTIRPHEALAMRRPLKVHLEAINDHQTIKSTEPESLPLS